MWTPIFKRSSEQPIYMQLRGAIIDEINQGRMTPGMKLPSVRQFAEHLKVSRTTIENTYSQLLAEGYIYSEQGRGYFVEAIDAEAMATREEAQAGQSPGQVYRYDFAKEYVAEEAFDFKLWKKHVNHVLNYDQATLYAYGERRGEMALREAICHQFYRSRGVVAKPGQLVVGSGVTPLITMLTRLFATKDIREVAVEEPGFSKAAHVLEAGGMTVSGLPVTFRGSDIHALTEGTARACYVSPSHQFPTGQIMSVSERQRLLKWADKCDGYIIEDDYNFELRYEGQPIPAMQSMDRDGRVIYMGSFSTVLAPAIRISFLVLPRGLNHRFDALAAMYPQTASKVEQLALAHMMTSGDFDRHIRRIRKHYSKKRELATRCLRQLLPEGFQVRQIKAGLQIIVTLPEGIEEKALVAAGQAMSVNTNGLGAYFFRSRGLWPPSLVIGIRGIEEADMVAGIRKIAQAAQGCSIP